MAIKSHLKNPFSPKKKDEEKQIVEIKIAKIKEFIMHEVESKKRNYYNPEITQIDSQLVGTRAQTRLFKKNNES